MTEGRAGYDDKIEDLKNRNEVLEGAWTTANNHRNALVQERRELSQEVTKLKAENIKLINTLNDWSDQYTMVVSGKCPPDEYHCACVPVLREELGRLQTALKVIGDVPSAYLTACEKRMKTIAKEALEVKK